MQQTELALRIADRSASLSTVSAPEEIVNRQSSIVNRRLPGVTLLELLVVVSLLMLMLGFGAGAYFRMSRSYKEQGAAADLDVVLRHARNSAVSANAPAFVTIDTETRTVTPWVYRTVGQWHFERSDEYGRSSGAYRPATLRGAEIFPDGKIGKCVKLRQNACVDLTGDPDYDCEDGGCLEAYLRLPSGYVYGGDEYVFSKSGAYSLRINSYGELVANTGGDDVRARGYRLPPGRWTKVALAWDRQSTRILVDDAIVGRGPGGKPQLTNTPLLVGHESGSFFGLVDEVRVMTAIPGRALQVPLSYTIQHTAAPWNAVFFATDGSLDMRYHAGPVTVSLIQDRRIRTISISMLGLSKREELDNLPPPAEAEEPPPAGAGAKAASPTGGAAPPAAK